MTKVIVHSETEAIEIARALQFGANSLKYYPKLSNIEEMAMSFTLCHLRDSIKIEARVAREEAR